MCEKQIFDPIPTTWPCKKFRSTNKTFGMSRVDKPNVTVNNQEGEMSFKNLISTTWAQHDPPGWKNKKDVFDEYTMA